MSVSMNTPMPLVIALAPALNCASGCARNLSALFGLQVLISPAQLILVENCDGAVGDFAYLWRRRRCTAPFSYNGYRSSVSCQSPCRHFVFQRQIQNAAVQEGEASSIDERANDGFAGMSSCIIITPNTKTDCDFDVDQDSKYSSCRAKTNIGRDDMLHLNKQLFSLRFFS